MLFFYGFGPFLFSLISTNLVNPDNKKQTVKVEKEGGTTLSFFDKDVSERAMPALRTFGLVWLVMSLIAVALVSRRNVRKPNDPQQSTELQ